MRSLGVRARLGTVAIEFTVGAEETHKIGEVGAKRMRRWLDCTYRFRIDQSIYDLDPNGHPYPKLRLPQLTKTSDAGEPIGRTFERFDLVGALLDEYGAPGRTLYVECKEYSHAGNQGPMYDEYLAVCYSGFVKRSKEVAAPADMEFMWATTHPFAQTNYAKLTTAEQVKTACLAHSDRLGDEEFEMSIAEQLAPRLWLAIVNQRVEEMMMGLELRKAVVARILELEVA
jgi:hypothetical protein